MSAALKGYADLVLQAERGVDYDLLLRDRGAKLTVLALHGGGIAPLIGSLAAEIAGESWNLYLLHGLRTVDNAALRLPALRYSELRCDGLLSRSLLALYLTDADGNAADQTIIVGGQNALLAAALLAALKDAGFDAEPTENRVVRLALQCYNRAQQGGAILTLPWGLRQSLVTGPLQPDELSARNDHTPRWAALVAAVRQGLADGLRAQGSDLTNTLNRFERATRAMQGAGALGPGARRQDD